MENLDSTRDTLIYSLSIEDVQNVADEEFGRELTIEEIKRVQELVERDIQWYDIIHHAIQEMISEKSS